MQTPLEAAPAPTKTPSPDTAGSQITQIAQPTPTAAVQALPATAAAHPASTLTDASWQWVSFTSPVEQYDVPNSQNYLLTFQPGGTLAIQADCNNVAAAYTADEHVLSIQPGPTTLAACAPDSSGEKFLKYLGFSANYFFQDGYLFIDMFADGGTLKFAPLQP
jgi:heat shock protein HslJ